MAGFAYHQYRERQAHDDEADTQIERLRADAVLCRNPPRGQRARGHGDISGELVQAHGQPTLLRTDEVNLHDDRRRPREALADAEQQVREQDPVPGGRPHEEEGHRHGNEPSTDQHVLAPIAIR
jgi:hypothetical protein